MGQREKELQTAKTLGILLLRKVGYPKIVQSERISEFIEKIYFEEGCTVANK